MCARSNRVGGTHHGHAVALTGKILGPLGLAWLILTGTWPPDTVILVLTNDLIWWNHLPGTCACMASGNPWN